MLHDDSSSDWGTTCDLVVRALQIKTDLIVSLMSDAPALPNATEWDMLKMDCQVLQALRRPVQILQKEDALAAQVRPCIMMTTSELGELSTADSNGNIPSVVCLAGDGSCS